MSLTGFAMNLTWELLSVDTGGPGGCVPAGLTGSGPPHALYAGHGTAYCNQGNSLAYISLGNRWFSPVHAGICVDVGECMQHWLH